MASSRVEEPHDFSLVLGGPTYRLFRRSHLAGGALQLLRRRVIFSMLFLWLPLLSLTPLSNVGHLPFFRDVEVHVRFLVALPILIAAELIVHLRTRPVIRAFVDRRIVAPEDLPRFEEAIRSAERIRNSTPIELGLLALVYTVGLWVWSTRIELQVPTWYAMPGGHWRLTPAGYWYVFISIPLFQFLLLRWYMRIFIWFRFLWQVSKMNLKLIPTHPDRCAGLAFLGKSAYAFSPILFAQGSLLAGLLATRILYMGESLTTFKLQIVGFIGFFLLVILGPLLMFTPRLASAKRKGLAEYGLLAQRYVEDFEQKWVFGKRAQSEEFLGTGDIQSLADLGNSYAIINEMRPIAFGLQDIGRLAAATAAPLLPLLLTLFSADELVMRVLRIVF